MELEELRNLKGSRYLQPFLLPSHVSFVTKKRNISDLIWPPAHPYMITKKKTNTNHSFNVHCLYLSPPHHTHTQYASLQLHQSFPHIFLIESLIPHIPSTQSRPPLRNISSSPHNPQLIHLPSRIIVWYENIEITWTDFIKHVLNRFGCWPCSSRFGSERLGSS